MFEAARLANLNQTEQETWEQSWIQGVPPGHDLVTDPTCPQPGFNLPRRQFFTLNRLRCGQARCAESLHRWGVIASPACPCGESHQTTMHIVEECPLTAFPGGLQRLHQAGHDAVEWLSRLSLKLWECSKRTTTTIYVQLSVSFAVPWMEDTRLYFGTELARCSFRMQYSASVVKAGFIFVTKCWVAKLLVL